LLTQDQYPHLKNLFLACVDGSLAVEAAERTGLDRHGVLELIKRLPARTHLALVQWSTARNPKAWQHGSRDEGDYVSEEAVGWLAQTFAEDSWNTMRSWTLRNPVAALDWLVSKRLDSKSAHAVMSNLPPDLEVRLLEWIEAQEPKDRPDNVFWWAAVTIERRPELADRLLPLLRFAVPDTPGLVH
jgi:hypothetical protein